MNAFPIPNRVGVTFAEGPARIRVGVNRGRYPEAWNRLRIRLAAALTVRRFFITGDQQHGATVALGSSRGDRNFASVVAPETPAGVTAFVISGVNPITEKQASANSLFIFATLDGTISGWNPAVGGISPTGASVANIAADRSSVGTTYTGLAIATSNGQRFLYAADDGANRRVDVFNSNFQLADLGANVICRSQDSPKICSL